MIINRGSFHRGFGHGMVFKTKIVEAANSHAPLPEQKGCKFTNLMASSSNDSNAVEQRHCTEKDEDGKYKLDDDGLPRIGSFLQQHDPLYCTVDHTGKPHIMLYKDEEPAYVESVTMIDGSCTPAASNRSKGQKASIKLRLTRNPVVGDKFSSRHGQKGVMSMLWPSEDMPFSESGITPDILFNPHGFPSRMTIGMLIESIAAKTGSLEGKRADATTFRGYRGHYTGGSDNESDPFLQQDEGTADDDAASQIPQGPVAAEYFGRCLKEHGFQRLGTERMYSGVHGTEMETEIFLGVVYYQRLRHMVAEKAQVRARGAVDKMTMQPVKGRKRHGGIRFGEMERDSLLAHGTSFLLHDRLMRSSDYDIGFVCPMCGSILTPQANPTHRKRQGEPWECPPCSHKAGKTVHCHPLQVPWVLRYLTCEFASMNIKMQLRLKDMAREVSADKPYKPRGNAPLGGNRALGDVVSAVFKKA